MPEPLPPARLPRHEDAFRFWYDRVNYEQKPPTPVDFKLERMRQLLRLLGNPQDRLRILHVAGSKGKGSTAAMLAAILARAGYRVGLFTSPHLVRVEERIQVDGEPILTDSLAGLLDEIRERLAAAGGALGEQLTFFEIATAVGLLYFLRRRVGVAVLEVGLGGRFDSTNVCQPELAVLTSISFDHTQVLGDRLASIAFEKAGIIKPGRPAVSGVVAPEARAVVERVCRERGAPLRELGTHFHYHYEPRRMTEAASASALLPRVQITTDRRAWPPTPLRLLGEHQAANAAVAVAAVEVLRDRGWHVADEAVADGLAGVRWPARMEVMGRRPFVVLDCAHNVASAQALVRTLHSCFPPSRRLLIFAGSGDKDLAGMLQELAPHFAHAYLTRYRDNPRGHPPEALADLLQRDGRLPFTIVPGPAEAYGAARAAAKPDDLICVAGSVFLAGELRPLLLDAPAE
jgi:dihydrofolate synthase/folylpolyglutamate synthase